MILNDVGGNGIFGQHRREWSWCGVKSRVDAVVGRGFDERGIVEIHRSWYLGGLQWYECVTQCGGVLGVSLWIW